MWITIYVIPSVSTIQSFPHITCCYVPVGKDIGSLICNVGSGAAAAGGGTATAGATDAAPQEEEKKEEKKEESEEESDDDMGFGNENYVLLIFVHLIIFSGLFD